MYPRGGGTSGTHVESCVAKIEKTSAPAPGHSTHTVVRSSSRQGWQLCCSIASSAAASWKPFDGFREAGWEHGLAWQLLRGVGGSSGTRYLSKCPTVPAGPPSLVPLPRPQAIPTYHPSGSQGW